ncbi:LOW QUALITY PROTEIN: melanoma-associated antigen B17 [Leptonychotes weddellii]|uniref:LOW QUALITY PROTEIN: melanoma-associated antigen B17 n=1 Tax=Leptonychotes weddellii TaxID=9713 RepID=A0A7F8R267_LEPWE|nr:LOW QUALITY PROTEIN: melanoma-associated antigen B17 [Leptonychotes weddellii]
MAYSDFRLESSGSSDEGAKSQGEESPSPCQALPSPESSHTDPLTRKAGILVHFLPYKYKMKEPITDAEILKVINKKYKEQFPEILKRTTERLELVFGLELKEVDPSSHSYTFVSKVGLPTEGRLSDGVGFPKNGLLMPLLGVIFMNGNGATEEETWEFLNVLGVYAGRRHLIFGEPRKLITKDLVQEKHLEYRQVADSDAPCYEFLWGPRGHAEASKMKVLEFLAKVSNTVYPSAFQGWYEEALRDEEERAQARVATQAATGAPASACSKATSSSPPQP